MKLYRFYIIPVLAVLVGLYLLGLSFWENRYQEPKSPMDVAISTQKPTATSKPATTQTTEGVGSATNSLSEEEEDAALAKISDRININTATPSELESLDGIGSVLAQRIVERREALGGFQSIQQLLNIQGIGPKIYAEIEAYITIE